jgi:hypothetical protein
MATFTLTANSNYSAIKGSLANDDTIDCDGFRLTVDEQPALTGIAVTSPGTAGRMTVSGAYDMSTWSITAGTAILIDGTFPSGATLGSATGGAINATAISTNAGTVTTVVGGTGLNARGIATNNGTVTNATGGTGGGAQGILTNNGTVTNATGGSAGSARGVETNNGTVTNATGGSANFTDGVGVNNGTVGSAAGGSVSGAHGVGVNNGTVSSATGGSNASAHGVNTNFAIAFAADNATGFGVNNSFSAIKVVDGPNYKSRIITSGTERPVTTVYSIGTLSSLASVSSGITVIEVNEAAKPKPSLRGGFKN